MVSIKELKERLEDISGYTQFGKNLIDHIQDKRVRRVADNFVAQLEIISDIYQRAIEKGEDRKYSPEELGEMRKSAFAEIELYRWLLEDYKVDSKTAFKVLDEPELLAYALLLVLKHEYAPNVIF